MEIITREATSCDLKDLVAKLIPEAIGKDIEKSCQGIYPLQVGKDCMAAYGRVFPTSFTFALRMCCAYLLS